MAQEKQKLDYSDPGFIAACIVALICDSMYLFGILVFAVPVIGQVFFFLVLFMHYFFAAVILGLMFAWFKKAETIGLKDFAGGNPLQGASKLLNFLFSSRVVMLLLYILPLPVLGTGIVIGVLLQSKLIKTLVIAVATEGVGAEAAGAAAETGEAAEAAEGAGAAEGEAGATQGNEAGTGEENQESAEGGGREKPSEEVVGAEGTTEQAEREAEGEGANEEKPEEEKSEAEKKKDQEKEEEDWDQNKDEEEEDESEEDSEEEIDLSRRQQSGNALPFRPNGTNSGRRTRNQELEADPEGERERQDRAA